MKMAFSEMPFSGGRRPRVRRKMAKMACHGQFWPKIGQNWPFSDENGQKFFEREGV